MEFQQFKDGMERLRSRKLWATSFDDGFADVLYEKIAKYPWAAFQASIKFYLGQHSKPTSDELAYSVKKRAQDIGHDAVETRINYAPCNFCDSSGIILMGAKKNQHGAIVGVAPFACFKCENGQIQKEINEKLALSNTAYKIGWRPESKKKGDVYESAYKRSQQKALPTKSEIIVSKEEQQQDLAY